MKKVFIVVFGALILAGCTKEDVIIPNVQEVTPELAISSSVGIKLQSPFVTSEVAMNVKSEVGVSATINIFDKIPRLIESYILLNGIYRWY